MRLTLRTLLAYLDDTLEPTEIKQIGQKVFASVKADRNDTPEHKAWAKTAAERRQAILAEIAAVNRMNDASSPLPPMAASTVDPPAA